MSKFYNRSIYTLSALLLFVLLGGPQMSYAWAMPNGPEKPAAALPDAPSATMQQEQQQHSNVPPATSLENSDAQTPAQQQATDQQSNDQQNKNSNKKDQTPLGAAAAPGAATAGGAASRPAGTALAPANQKQRRSLLIKLGLVAAGAAAIGTVYALSHATGPLPPGATH